MTASKVHIRVVLFREGCGFGDALKDNHPLVRIASRDDLDIDLRLFVLPRRPSPPSWLGFVRGAAAEEMPDLLNQSSGAVLLVLRGERLWGLTFGLGHLYLDEERVEPQFGLRTALNTVDPTGLQQVGSRVYEDVVVSTSRQASRRGGREVFAIDDMRDILRQVVGVPRDEAAFGRLITGSRALSLTIPVEPATLAERLDAIAGAHASEVYKEEFGFIDFIQPITEANLVDRLDATLVEAVAGLRPAEVYLAPPEAIIWDDVEGFLHTGERVAGPAHPELELSDYRVRVRPDDVTAAALRRHEVRMIAASTGAEIRSWSIYRCLVFEAELDGRLFLLSEGEWFEVERDFSTQVTNDVTNISPADLGLPTARRGEQESAYNARAAEECGLALLDRRMFKFGGSQFEVADLVGRDGHLIHVKRKTQSATLSHLFAQGRVSAEALKVDAQIRQRVADELEDRGRPEAALFRGPNYRPNDFTVVYAVVARNADQLPARLPFFSRLNLWHARRFLSSTLDYKVAFSGIGQS